jgi:hypothetical protein
MIVKILILAILAYVAWRMLRGDLRRTFTHRSPPPEQAMDTVRCRTCRLYLPKGMEKACGLKGCPYG